MARKQNAWLVHVKKTLRENRDKSFKQVLKLAKKTYKKSAASESKGVRKSRRHNKTKRGGSGSGSGSGEQHDDESSQQGGNQHQQEEGPQQGKQHGGSSGNPLLDMVKGAGAQKGGSGGGSSTGKAVFGDNAAPVS